MPGHAVARVAGVATSPGRSPTPYLLIVKAIALGMDVPSAGVYPWREHAFYRNVDPPGPPRSAMFPRDGSVCTPVCYDASGGEGFVLVFLEDVRSDAGFAEAARQLHGRYGEECVLSECLGSSPLLDEESREQWEPSLRRAPPKDDFRNLRATPFELAISLVALGIFLAAGGFSAFVVAFVVSAASAWFVGGHLVWPAVVGAAVVVAVWIVVLAGLVFQGGPSSLGSHSASLGWLESLAAVVELHTFPWRW